MPIFKITHYFDRDGGFGDAVRVSETLGYAEFVDQAAADAWCKANDKTHVYDVPYQELRLGTLQAEAVVVSHSPDGVLPEWWADMEAKDVTSSLYYYDDDNDDDDDYYYGED